MPGQRIIHVRAPTAGVYKRSSFQGQPPFTSYSSLNFWVKDYKDGSSRDRVATRPGFTSFSAVTSANMQALVHLAQNEEFTRLPMIGADGDLYAWDDSTDAFVVVTRTLTTVTFADGAPGLLMTTSADWATYTPFRVSGGTLPTGLAVSTTYYTVRVSPTTSKIATSLANAVAGTVIAHTNSGSGTISMRPAYVDMGRPVCAFGYLQKLYVLNQTLKYKTYNYDDGLVVTWSGSPGVIPPDCHIGCVWDDRIILAGDPAYPHVVNFSRQGEPNDWDFAEEDVAAAIASTSIEGGNISEPVTALVPHNRQCLLVGGWNTWLAYRGNPRRGGNLVRISHCNGPICWTAWCKTADDWLYYMSRDGLYKMPPGCGDNPTSVSREYIPEELLALDGITDIAYLEYDVRFRMIHIYVTGPRASYYHFFPETGAFCPQALPTGTVTSLYRFDQFETDNASGVLVGMSGAMYRLDRTATLESGAEAYLQIGPIKLDDALDRGGIIQEANMRWGGNTTDVNGTLEIFGADDAEDVVAMPDDRSFSETIEVIEDNNGRTYPGVSGHAAFINIELDDRTKHISYEQLDLHVTQYGKD